MKRLRNTLCVLSISIVILCGFVTARDEKYVSYFLHLYSAGLFRDRNFVLHDAKAYFNKDHIVRVEMSFSCYKNLALEEARKMLCAVAMDFVDRVNSDPGLKEKALIKDRFIPRQLHLRILCDNVMGQTFETNFIREIILDRGHVTYISFKDVPEWYGRSTTYHEDFDYALMLVGNRRSQDEIIDQSTVKPQILGIPGDVSDFPLRQYHELLPESEFPIAKKEKAPEPAPLIPVLVQIIPVELFNELGIWTPPPPPPPPAPPPVEKPEEVKPQAPAAVPTEPKQAEEAKAQEVKPAAALTPSSQKEKTPEQQPQAQAPKADVVPNSLQPQAQEPVVVSSKDAGVQPQATSTQTEPKAPSTEKPAAAAPQTSPEMPERLKLSEEKGEVLLSKNEPVQDSTEKSKVPSLPENQIADSQVEADEQIDLIQLLQNALDNLSDTKDSKEAPRQPEKPATPPSQPASNEAKQALADELPVAVVDKVVIDEAKEVPFITFDAQSPQRTAKASQAKGHTESDRKLLYIEATSEKAFLQTPDKTPVEVLGDKQAVALDVAPTNNESMQEVTTLDQLMDAAEQEMLDSPNEEPTPEKDDQDLEMPEYPVGAEKVVQVDPEKQAPKRAQADDQRGFLDFLFGSAKKEEMASQSPSTSNPSQEKPAISPPSDARDVAMNDADELQESRESGIENALTTQTVAETSKSPAPEQEVKEEPKKGFFDFLFGSSQKESTAKTQPSSAQDSETFDTSDADDEDDDIVGLADDLDEDDEIANEESAEQNLPPPVSQEVKQEPKKGFFDFLFGSSQKETESKAQTSDVQEEMAMSDEDELQAAGEPDVEEAIAAEEKAEQSSPTAPPVSEQKQEEKQAPKQEAKKGFFDFLFGSSEKEAKPVVQASEAQEEVAMSDEGELETSNELEANETIALGNAPDTNPSIATPEQKKEEKQEAKQEPKKGFFNFLFGSSENEAQSNDNAAEDVADEGLVAMGDDDAEQANAQQQKQEIKQEPKKGFFDFLFGSSEKEAAEDDNAAEDVVDEGLVALGDDDSDQSDNARSSKDPVLAELFSEPTDWLDDRAATSPSGNWAASNEAVQSDDTVSPAVAVGLASTEANEEPGTLHRWYNSLKTSIESIFAKKDQQAQNSDIQVEEIVETEEDVQGDPQNADEKVEKVLIFSDDQSQ